MAATGTLPRPLRFLRPVVNRPLDSLEDLGEQRRAPCYTVSFAAADLWPDDDSDHAVLVDLWETYLEEAG